MKKGEAEAPMPTLCEKWAEAAKQPWQPDSQHHYSLSQFWSWVGDKHHPYTQFRVEPDARYVAGMWFDKIMRQAGEAGWWR
jgi:hypothetical protein